MSERNADGEMELGHGKRQTTLTAKAWANKIEKLQLECKITVNKMKALIPEIKALMKTKENVSYVQSNFEKLNQLCENTTMSHEVLIPLLMEDEQNRLNKWFSSIMNYSNTFKENVKRWLSESEEPQENNSLSLPQSAINEEVLPCPTKDEPQVSTQAATIISTEDMQDDITPSDSVSNVRSKTPIQGESLSFLQLLLHV